MSDPKSKYTPKGKMTRVQEVQQEMQVLARARDKTLADLTGERKDAEQKVRVETSTAAGRNAAETKQEVDALRKKRDSLKADAEKARDIAVRKAKSDFDQAVNVATQAFETARDALEKQLFETNRPHRDALDQGLLDVLALHATKVEAVEEEYQATVAPLIEEMRALQQAEEEKRAKDAMATANATVVVPTITPTGLSVDPAAAQ